MSYIIKNIYPDLSKWCTIGNGGNTIQTIINYIYSPLKCSSQGPFTSARPVSASHRSWPSDLGQALATQPFIYPLPPPRARFSFPAAFLLQPPTKVYPPAACAAATRWCSVWPTGSGTAMPPSPTRRGSSRPQVRIPSSPHILFSSVSAPFLVVLLICFGCGSDVFDRFAACACRWQARVPVHQEESQRAQVPRHREEDPGGESLLF